MVTQTTINVIIITNGFQTDYMLNLVHNLSEYCKVTLICSEDLAQFKFNSNVIVKNLRGSLDPNVSIKYKATRIIKYYFKIFSFIIKSKIKVLHIQWLKYYMIEGVLFSLFARLIGKKVVYTAHDVIPHDKDTLLNRLIFRLIYKSQNVIIAHTMFIKQRLHDEFNVPKNKVYFIEHGVYNVLKNEDINLKIARKKYNLKVEDFVILFFGRIAKYKGIDLIASSINNFSDENKSVKLLLAGEVSKDYKIEFFEYFNNIDSTNIVTRFCFIDDEEVELLFKASNVTILPYKEASQSGVLFLSYAYGVPVIAPKLGGFPNYILHNKTGLLYDPNDVSNFMDTVNTAIKVFNTSNSKINKSIENFAYENFSWNSSCKQLSKIYNEFQ